MQSSAMVALRTMILITCLVAVPLAAVFGTALPKVVQSAFDRGKTSPWNRPATTDDEPSPPVLAMDSAAMDGADAHAAPAPPNSESTTDHSLRLPLAHITGVRPIDDRLLTPPSAATVQTAPLWNPPAPRTAQAPKTRDMTAHFVPSPAPHRTDEAHARHEPRAGGLQKTVYSQPHGDAAEDSAEDHDQLVAVERADSGRADNVLADGERRLRRLGATYYRLETWGGESQFYRCSCNIAVGAGSRATRHFEATEAAPSQAIEAVIKQVDAWRSRRRAG